MAGSLLVVLVARALGTAAAVLAAAAAFAVPSAAALPAPTALAVASLGALATAALGALATAALGALATSALGALTVFVPDAHAPRLVAMLSATVVLMTTLDRLETTWGRLRFTCRF